MSDTPGAAAPTISVIIPTRNRRTQLGECLTALTEQAYPRDDFEVIVVDDGSAQTLDDVVHAFRDRLHVRLIRQQQQGPAAARNRGIAEARGRIVAFTDDDCRAAPEWLGALARRFECTGERLVGGQVHNALTSNPFAITSQLIHDLAYSHHNPDGSAQFFATNNLAATREGLVRLGAFDPGFAIASEDRDLCARWRESGHELVYAPEAQVAHAHHLTLSSFWAQHFRYGRGAWRYHAALRRRGQGRFARDLSFHAQFLRRAGTPLKTRGNAVSVALLLGVWQIANLTGFIFEAVASRLISRGPAAKIS
ncbi:MAG: glycosyltransferase [Gemmatimonadota bacterium]